jgi:hypothetical protein
MSPDGTYNGYANYQTWNVCLWISNDEYLSNIACRSANYAEFKDNMRLALYSAYRKGIGYETPDGVAWNDSAINQHEVAEFWSENFSKEAA